MLYIRLGIWFDCTYYIVGLRHIIAHLNLARAACHVSLSAMLIYAASVVPQAINLSLGGVGAGGGVHVPLMCRPQSHTGKVYVASEGSTKDYSGDNNPKEGNYDKRE